MKTSLRIRKCCQCPERFMQQRPMQKACSPACAQRDAEVRRLKQEAARKREERQADRAKRQAMKPLRTLMAEAQKEFNAFVRERDKAQPCISCGTSLQTESSGVGGGYDCGHYRSTGSASHLRFDEANAHGQCKFCNRHRSGNVVAYRSGLIERIGLDAIHALESSNAPRKWARGELIHIRDHYRAKLKQLKKEESCSRTI